MLLFIGSKKMQPFVMDPVNYYFNVKFASVQTGGDCVWCDKYKTSLKQNRLLYQWAFSKFSDGGVIPIIMFFVSILKARKVSPWWTFKYTCSSISRHAFGWMQKETVLLKAANWAYSTDAADVQMAWNNETDRHFTVTYVYCCVLLFRFLHTQC